jgi:hypothetical protein
MASDGHSKVARLHGRRLVLVEQKYNRPRTPGKRVDIVLDMGCPHVRDLSSVHVDSVRNTINRFDIILADRDVYFGRACDGCRVSAWTPS